MFECVFIQNFVIKTGLGAIAHDVVCSCRKTLRFIPFIDMTVTFKEEDPSIVFKVECVNYDLTDRTFYFFGRIKEFNSIETLNADVEIYSKTGWGISAK